MSLIEAAFDYGGDAVFRGASDRVSQDMIARHFQNALPLQDRSTAIKDRPLLDWKVVVEGRKAQTLVRSIPEHTDFEGRIFNALVSLKVAVSQYAMHLSHEERHRIFGELDCVINTEDWHEGDELPKLNAFQDFLKWMIYSKYFKWISIGASDDGSLLVAWKTKRVLLSAKFSGKSGQEAVRWSAQITSKDGETGHTVGKCPLRLFSEQANFYLAGADDDLVAEQH